MVLQRIMGIGVLLLVLTGMWIHGTVGAQESIGAGTTPIAATPADETAITPFDAPGLAVSFITSTSPTCSQPDPALNVCYINWDTLYVSSAPATYMLAMTVTIDSRIRAVYRGFFQDALHVDNEMHGQGFKVACGSWGASGNPLTSLRHTYTIVAEDSNRAKAYHSGSVNCPAARSLYLSLVLRR